MEKKENKQEGYKVTATASERINEVLDKGTTENVTRIDSEVIGAGSK